MPFAPIVHPKMNSGKEFPSAFSVAAFGRKPPIEFPAQFAALCRDAAASGFQRDKSARFPCGFLALTDWNIQ
jgi:hypothetical protein